MFSTIVVVLMLVYSPLFALIGGSYFSANKVTQNNIQPVFQLPYATAESIVPFLEVRDQAVFYPARNWSVQDIEIEANSFIAIDLESPEKILAQKNAGAVVSIASLTKLMTALIVSEYLPPEEEIQISKSAVLMEGQMGNLIVGEKISVQNLLKIMLITSSNDATEAFRKTFAEKELDLVMLMNDKAKQLGLNNTFFSDVSGLDKNTVSTATDMAFFAKKILGNKLIANITRTVETQVKSIDNVNPHLLNNSNNILGKYSNVLLSKTGTTESAGECLLMVLTIDGKDSVAFIILGSKSRFKEMQSLISWTQSAYLWK